MPSAIEIAEYVATFMPTVFLGDDYWLSGIDGCAEAGTNSQGKMVFIGRSAKNHIGLFNATKAGLILIDCDILKGNGNELTPIVVCPNARLAFIKAVIHFFPKRKADVKVGFGVVIKEHAVIGGEGFGLEKDGDSLINFPHIGGVVIGDDVMVGSCTCIDRGSLWDTVIGDGTKIDNLVHIAHNCQIGKNVVIVAHSMLGGGCRIGDWTWIGPGVQVAEKVSIGSHCQIGMGAVVLDDIPDGKVAYGIPARIVRDNKGHFTEKNYAAS